MWVILALFGVACVACLLAILVRWTRDTAIDIDVQTEYARSRRTVGVLSYCAEENDLEEAAFRDLNILARADSDANPETDNDVWYVFLLDTKTQGHWLVVLHDGTVTRHAITNPRMDRASTVQWFVDEAHRRVPPLDHRVFMYGGHSFGWYWVAETGTIAEEDGTLSIRAVANVLRAWSWDLCILDTCQSMVLETVVELASCTPLVLGHQLYGPWIGFVHPCMITAFRAWDGTQDGMAEACRTLARACIAVNSAAVTTMSMRRSKRQRRSALELADTRPDPIGISLISIPIVVQALSRLRPCTIDAQVDPNPVSQNSFVDVARYTGSNAAELGVLWQEGEPAFAEARGWSACGLSCASHVQWETSRLQHEYRQFDAVRRVPWLGSGEPYPVE